MTKVKFRIGSDKRKDPEYIKGRIIKEYKHFYLIETEAGYKTCIDKSLIMTGEIERVM